MHALATDAAILHAYNVVPISAANIALAQAELNRLLLADNDPGAILDARLVVARLQAGMLTTTTGLKTHVGRHLH